MPQKDHSPKRVRISFTTNEQVEDLLQALVDTGLYGASVPEAAEVIVCNFLQDNLKRLPTKALEREKNI